MNRNTRTFLGCDAQFDGASVVLFGAPFDATASFRPGTRFGPDAMRGDSVGMETYSPYQDRDLSDLSVCDAGDLELPFGSPARALDMIAQTAREILESGKKPFMLGGEHLVTLGAVTAAHERYPDLHLIHLDAHTDLRESYLNETLSHATVMRRVWDRLGDGRIHQFGIRSGEKDEFTFAAEHTDLHKFSLDGFDAVVDNLKCKPIYLSLDLDVLDPSALCGTGTPEAGGVRFQELLDALLKLKGLNIVGCDITELCPVYDQSGASTATACKLTREILLLL